MLFFLFRSVNPSLQLVNISLSNPKTRSIQHASFTALANDEYHGSRWRAEELPYSALETCFLQSFKRTIPNRSFQESTTKLVNMNNPSIQIPLIAMTSEYKYMPARGGHEILLQDIHNKSTIHWVPLPPLPPLSDEDRERIRRILALTREREEREEQERYIPTQAIARREPLSPFVAKMIAELAIQKQTDCPITMDSLASYTSVIVPNCGHVCSPCAKSQTKCPVCREEVQWTEVTC